jgi:erythromycin esterase-like protein
MAARLPELMRTAAKPLPSITDASFGSYFDHLGKYKVVCLGDGSHGTSEFYHARAEITKYLVEHHGFDTVAVEADWPDAEVIDRYVRQRPGVKAKIGYGKEEPFQRFPTWMWRNKETQDLVHWMRDHNAKLSPEKRVGFYGLDLYSMGRSIQEVTKYLDRVDPAMAKVARRRYGCLQPWADDPAQYGLSTYVDSGMGTCEVAVVKMLRELLQKRLEYATDQHDGEEFHSTEQNAYLVADAESYYRAMYSSSADSWSLRDSHMFETLRRLLNRAPDKSKAIVWAHNSHLGDARYTGMGRSRGELNVGQLCRENLGRANVALVGCSTHTGTVAAANQWDDDLEIMKVRPSRPDSWEILANETGIPSFILDLRREIAPSELRQAMAEASPRLERFIGVIYRPSTERMSHYSSADLADQLDALVWFDESKAVQPLEMAQPKTPLGVDETYPFGL